MQKRNIIVLVMKDEYKITRAMAAEMIKQTLKYKAENPIVAKNLKTDANINMKY